MYSQLFVIFKATTLSRAADLLKKAVQELETADGTTPTTNVINQPAPAPSQFLTVHGELRQKFAPYKCPRMWQANNNYAGSSGFRATYRTNWTHKFCCLGIPQVVL